MTTVIHTVIRTWFSYQRESNTPNRFVPEMCYGDAMGTAVCVCVSRVCMNAAPQRIINRGINRSVYFYSLSTDNRLRVSFIADFADLDE